MAFLYWIETIPWFRFGTKLIQRGATCHEAWTSIPWGWLLLWNTNRTAWLRFGNKSLWDNSCLTIWGRSYPLKKKKNLFVSIDRQFKHSTNCLTKKLVIQANKAVKIGNVAIYKVHRLSFHCSECVFFSVRNLPVRQTLLQYTMYLKTHLYLISREISSTHNLFLGCPIASEVCIEYGRNIAVLCAKFKTIE